MNLSPLRLTCDRARSAVHEFHAAPDHNRESAVEAISGILQSPIRALEAVTLKAPKGDIWTEGIVVRMEEGGVRRLVTAGLFLPSGMQVFCEEDGTLIQEPLVLPVGLGMPVNCLKLLPLTFHGAAGVHVYDPFPVLQTIDASTLRVRLSPEGTAAYRAGTGFLDGTVPASMGFVAAYRQVRSLFGGLAGVPVIHASDTFVSHSPMPTEGAVDIKVPSKELRRKDGVVSRQVLRLKRELRDSDSGELIQMGVTTLMIAFAGEAKTEKREALPADIVCEETLQPDSDSIDGYTLISTDDNDPHVAGRVELLRLPQKGQLTHGISMNAHGERVLARANEILGHGRSLPKNLETKFAGMLFAGETLALTAVQRKDGGLTAAGYKDVRQEAGGRTGVKVIELSLLDKEL